MEWKQIFEYARKNKTFSRDDLTKAGSWPHCAVGDNLRSRGYKKTHTSGDLGYIVDLYSKNLAEMGYSFTLAVSNSERMLKNRARYNSEDEYNKKCMYYINEAQKIYNNIQKTEPSQALIDKLKLTVTPTSPA